jgi:hypothetical protein
MSELVSRVHKLSDEIIYLKERILEEQRKYADEVDHSDQLAHFLTLLHDGKKCILFCSFCDIVRTHETRRTADVIDLSVSNSTSVQIVVDP